VILLGVAFLLALGMFLFVRLNSTPPRDFPINTDIVIREGMTQVEIVNELVEASVVKSSLLLNLTLKYYFKNKFILAGTYQFPGPHSVREVAQALTEGLHKSPTFKLVLPEGFATRDFYNMLPEGYRYTYTQNIIALEGYLFPDTYFITNDMSVDAILVLLQETMKEKLLPYRDAIVHSGFTEHEVLTLASIIEREANDQESMRLVSGILQNRLTQGMSLQVDATLDYILDKTSAELTLDDLELDSPFNTYKYGGLPPHPIANPGLNSIEAVLYPTETDYLYYLTGDDGKFYYAKTFEQHKQNKARYLR
jgi:UPF0755 protein